MAAFLLDMGISRKAIPILQRRGHTALHVEDLALAFADDRVILDEGRSRNAVVVTSDKDLANYVSIDRARSPSVITLRLDNPNAAEQIAALNALLDALTPDQLDACIITLERNRFRRRALGQP